MNTELSEDTEIKEEIQFNYTCGILTSLINHCIKSSDKGTYLLNLVLRTLFAHKKKKGNIWIPHKSPWVSARICICLFPIYDQWKSSKKNSDLVKEYISKLEDVVNILADKNKTPNYFWMSETGSHFDTSALCIEMIYLYNKHMDNKLKIKIEPILKEYVRGNSIKETFIKFPIFNSLIEQVCNNEYINGKPAFKKLCGRIEWYTILYIICKDWGFDDDELREASDYIAMQLKRFWSFFVGKSDCITQHTIEQEKSCVPQILYCLKRTKLFD